VQQSVFVDPELRTRDKRSIVSKLNLSTTGTCSVTNRSREALLCGHLVCGPFAASHISVAQAAVDKGRSADGRVSGSARPLSHRNDLLTERSSRHLERRVRGTSL